MRAHPQAAWAEVGRHGRRGEDSMEKERQIEDFGMTPAEGKEIRSRLEPFATDWESPDMNAYDNYDTARKALEHGDVALDL